MTEQPELRFEPVEEFAALDEPGADPLASAADGGVVIPVDGDVLVYGDGGAGKTTLVLDLCWALAAGGSWLDIVTASRPLRVTIIENEGSRPEFRRKLRAKLAATGAELDGRIAVLADPWAELSLAVEQHRQVLALALREQETDLLVVGPLVSAGEFPTGGTPTEIVAFEEHTRMLRRLLDRPLALAVIHHENKSGGVSGGWGRYGDTHLHVFAQGNGRTRIEWAKAKWASGLTKTTTQLVWADGESFTVEARPEVTEDSMREQLLDAVRDHPGASWTKLRDLHDDHGERIIRGTGEAIAKTRDRLLQDGTLTNTAARDGRYELWVADDPDTTRSAARTDSERLPSAPADTEAESDPFAVRSIESERARTNGDDEPQTTQNDDQHETERLADLARHALQQDDA